MRSKLAAVGLLFGLLSFGPAPAAPPGDDPRAFIAIIVDDLGHNLERGERALALPAPVTVAMLPHAEYSTELAERALAAGREIMVHMPMANVSGKQIGPGGLLPEPEMSEQDFVRLLDDALTLVPNAGGINNHMGSLLTSRPLEMHWLMREIKRRELFFVDSRTTTETVAATVAAEHAVFNASRDVFLDNDPRFEAIDEEFERLIDTARTQGAAIAIGHPHPATLEYLEGKLPGLAARGIRVVPVSHAIALQRILRARRTPVAEAAME